MSPVTVNTLRSRRSEALLLFSTSPLWGGFLKARRAELWSRYNGRTTWNSQSLKLQADRQTRPVESATTRRRNVLSGSVRYRRDNTKYGAFSLVNNFPNVTTDFVTNKDWRIRPDMKNIFALFSQLDSIKPSHWKTKRNMQYRIIYV